MSELLMIEQRGPVGSGARWMLDQDGQRIAAHDNDRRIAELRAGLVRHDGVRPTTAKTTRDEVRRMLGTLHEPGYLEALGRTRSTRPVLLPELAAPGVAPDTPVTAAAVAAAYEGVRTAIAAADRIVAGARYAYALCRPPGHHAGPAWLGGYCYLNTAAAAAQTLRDGGAGPVGILDLDFHYANGTAAIVAHMPDTHLHSLHASSTTHYPWQLARPHSERERVVEFASPPDPGAYLEAVAASVGELSRRAAVLVLSLGYDTVAGDPHGSWSFSPAIFVKIGRLLAASGRPVCVVQEGGYALRTLAACGFAFALGLLDGGPA